MSTYRNGPGIVPRLPDGVVDDLIATAGVSRLAYDDKDQSAQVERLVHDACEELIARLTFACPGSPHLAGQVVISPVPWEERYRDGSTVTDQQAMQAELREWRRMFAQGDESSERAALIGAAARQSVDGEPAATSDEQSERGSVDSGNEATAIAALAVSDIPSAFQEYLYRVSSQVPFEHAFWANERGAALMAALKSLCATLASPALPVVLHRPRAGGGWYEADADYTEQLRNSITAKYYEFRTVYLSPTAIRLPEPFDWFHTKRNSDGTEFTFSTRQGDPSAFPLYALTQRPSADARDVFCDTHCVWTDHHRDCPHGRAQRAANGHFLDTQALLRIIAENTGKRISLSLDDLDQYLAVAHAAIAASRAEQAGRSQHER